MAKKNDRGSKKDRDPRQSTPPPAVPESEPDAGFGERLKDAIDKYYGGNTSAFARAAGKDYHRAYRWIGKTKKEPEFKSVRGILHALREAGMSPVELIELLGEAIDEPAYPAWREFLATPGLRLTDDEMLYLRTFPWGRKEPNVLAYATALTLYRMTPDRQDELA